MNRKVTIYLADMVNTHFGARPWSVPLAIGYIKAYAVSLLSKEVDIRLLRTFESLYEAIENKEPDILGCSWYGWNFMLTVNALTYIKHRYPGILTVVGGANVPENAEDCLRDLMAFPSIDTMIPNEGEIPFVNLVKVFIQGGKEAVFKTPIDGVFYLSDSREAVTIGNPIPLVKDINVFPSPYLNGHLDYFLDNDFIPMLQTARGCPYQCAFCVSAKVSWNKVRAFDTERVKEEISYLESRAKNKGIRFTDENFGLLPRDLEIAEFIAERKEKSGYPISLSLYTDKHINNRIKKIASLLRNLIPMNISTQTMTEAVLKNIHRHNIGYDLMLDSVEWGHHNNINVTTEIIFGLPGETYESFMESINKLVKLRFDSVAIGTLLMLKETELNRPDIIKKYRYKILYSVAERGYTKAGEFESVETDSWAVESDSFSFEDYIKGNLFILVYYFFMFCGYFKEAVYLWDTRDVKVGDVFSEILENPAKYPFFHHQLERLKKCLMDNLFETKEEVCLAFIRRYRNGEHISLMNPYILSNIIWGDMIHPSNSETTIEEALCAATAVFNKQGKGDRVEFLSEMKFVKSLVQSVIIPFWEMPQDMVTLSSPYDLLSWRNQNYKGTLSDFRLSTPLSFTFKVNFISLYNNFIGKNSGKPFCQQSEIFFRAFRTSNIRRFIVSGDVEK